MNARSLIEAVRLQRIQWKSPREIRRIQEDKLRALLRHAFLKVPYYREMLDGLGLKPADIRSVEDLTALPVTTKRRMADLPVEAKIASGTRRETCRTASTSGTTGDPLTIFLSPEDATRLNLSWIRGYLAAGMRPWHVTAAFVGRASIRESRSWYEKIGLWRRCELSAWNRPEEWVEALRKIRPDVINGYVMTLKLLAEEIRARFPDPASRGFHPRRVFHSSAVLDDASRRSLESILGAKVTDFYGADEAGCIAWECGRCGGYHVNADQVIVEILRDGHPVRPGEDGEITVTNLGSAVMPFIRYGLGDIGGLSLSPVRCGRGLPLLRRIEGRSDDFIRLETGEKISPHPVYHCLDPVPGIRRWRVLQPDLHTLDVALEPGPGFSENTIRSVRANLENLFRGRVDLEIRAVEALPVSPSAKFRAVRSAIGEPGP